MPPTSSSFAPTSASSGASTLFPDRSAACGPDGPVHTACLSTPSSSAPASNVFPFPDLSHHHKSGESGAPVSGGAAAACSGPFSAAIISMSAAPGAAVTCPLAPCCAAADCAAVPAMLLHPVAAELQVISPDPDQSPDSQIAHGVDRSSARRADGELIPLPAARSVPMPNPAAAASACTVHDAAASQQTQLAPLHVSSAVVALSPQHAPDPYFQPPSPGHLLLFATASPPSALQPSVTRYAPAAGRALNQLHCLSSCSRATAAQPCENAWRWSFVPPALPSASYAALGDAAAAHVLKKGKHEGLEAVCVDDAPFLSSSRSAASCVDSHVQRQHGGETKQLRQRICERKNVQRDPPLNHQLQPRPLRHEDGATRLSSSISHFRADAVAVAVLLCLSCIVHVAAAQLEACPGAWSTAALSVARSFLAATSLPNQGLAIFAGGRDAGL